MAKDKQLNLFGEKPKEYKLTLTLTYKWWDLINANTKLAEYRKMTKMLKYRISNIAFGLNSSLEIKLVRGYTEQNICRKCYAVSYYKSGKAIKTIPYRGFANCEPVPLVWEWGATEEFTGVAFGLLPG